MCFGAVIRLLLVQCCYSHCICGYMYISSLFCDIFLCVISGLSINPLRKRVLAG